MSEIMRQTIVIDGVEQTSYYSKNHDYNDKITLVPVNDGYGGHNETLNILIKEEGFWDDVEGGRVWVHGGAGFIPLSKADALDMADWIYSKFGKGR